MWVKIYREAGYEEAARAVRLSRDSVEFSDTVMDDLGPVDKDLFIRLLRADEKVDGDPHSVGLRQVVFWLGVNMPLFWWKQMDRYTEGKTQASASTMYGLMKRLLTPDDFTGGIDPRAIAVVNEYIRDGNFKKAVENLPGSYLQERSPMMSLITLRRILSQRRNHKLPEWRFFCNEIMRQAKYPELLEVR